jgi:predicted DNA-binding antitoxin AbrB/MazE fold protein
MRRFSIGRKIVYHSSGSARGWSDTEVKPITTQIEAIYEQSRLRPLQPLDLAEGMKVEIIVIAPVAAKLAAMREAMNDPLFLADLQEVAEDFQYVDAEGDAK